MNNDHNQINAIKSNLAASNNNINVQSINLTNIQGTVTNLPLQSIQVYRSNVLIKSFMKSALLRYPYRGSECR